MKKIITLIAMFASFAISASAQYVNTASGPAGLSEVHYRSQVFKSVPAYSWGGHIPMVYNVTAQRVDAYSVETDSSRNYLSAGSPMCIIRYASRDTIQLINDSYTAMQSLSFIDTNPAIDTTVYIPASGTINGSATYTTIGAANAYNAVTFYFDGTNYFIQK